MRMVPQKLPTQEGRSPHLPRNPSVGGGAKTSGGMMGFPNPYPGLAGQGIFFEGDPVPQGRQGPMRSPPNRMPGNGRRGGSSSGSPPPGTAAACPSPPSSKSALAPVMEHPPRHTLKNGGIPATGLYKSMHFGHHCRGTTTFFIKNQKCPPPPDSCAHPIGLLTGSLLAKTNSR